MTSVGERPWAVLAFDHRERAFASVRPSGMTRQEIRDGKELIYESFLVAVDRGLGDVRSGVLVDEEFGASVARRAASSGHALVMPVERAFEPVFTFEYGAHYREHVLEFQPTYAKALIHHRTSNADVDRQTQLGRLRELSGFVAEHSIGFMLELIVGQVEDGSGVPTVDLEVLCDSMAEIQQSGVRVDLWKVEGIASPDDASRVAKQAAESSHPAPCIVLGGGAPSEVVGRWLDVAAATPGFSGFAIGRSIWGEPVSAWLDGRLARESAIERIAATYRSCALRYTGAMVG